MATIERKPLPPPNYNATSITEADRVEMMAQANAVIDYYLNGPGSYWDAGPRKPLVGEERGDNTVNDLKKFKESVIASKQYADDPNSILDSVIDLIDKTTQQIKRAAQNQYGRDDIRRSLPSTNDPIVVPRVIGPEFADNATLPISLEGGPPAADTKNIRVLGRFAPDGTRLDSYPPLKPGLKQPQTTKPLSLITGQPMPDYPVPPMVFGLPDRPAASGDNMDDWFSRWIKPLMEQ